MRRLVFGLLGAVAFAGSAGAAGLDRPQYWPEPGNPSDAIGTPDATADQGAPGLAAENPSRSFPYEGHRYLNGNEEMPGPDHSAQ